MKQYTTRHDDDKRRRKPLMLGTKSDQDLLRKET